MHPVQPDVAVLGPASWTIGRCAASGGNTSLATRSAVVRSVGAEPNTRQGRAFAMASQARS
jgi:hypothetical protein